MANRKTVTADEVIDEIACGCVLTRTRLVSRVLTGLYDEALRPFGMGSPQFSLLVVIARIAPASRADVGRYNHLDRSTLTRNLQLLLAGGWIEEVARTSGGRGRPLVLTPAGRELIVAASRAWKEAQAKAADVFGQQAFRTLMRVGDGLMKLPPAH